METFEEKLRALFASKLITDSTDFMPSPKDSLEVLLDHVCEKAMAPAYYILSEQEQFALSSFQSHDGEFGDALGDGIGDRRVANLRVFRLQEPLFEYWLSFDGDHETGEASLWRKVEINRAPAFDLENPPADLFDFMDDSKPGPFKEYIGKSTLDEYSINLIEEYQTFPTLDMNEAVRLVQDDLYFVFNTLL